MDLMLEKALLGLSQLRRKGLYEECRAIALDRELHIGGKPIPFFSIPLMLPRSRLQGVLGKLNHFIDALVRLEEKALLPEGKPLYDRLMASLTPGGRHLVEQCRHESPESLRSRLRRVDGFWDFNSDRYTIIEVNQAAPLAIHYHDVGQRIGQHVLETLGIQAPANYLSRHMLEWFFAEYRRHAGRLPDTIALVIQHGYPPKFTDLPNMAKACEKLAREIYGHSLRFEVCFPYDLSLQDGKIMLGDSPIDMVWRNSVYLQAYRDQGLDVSDYEAICCQSDRFLIINATRSWLTRTKEAFALFCEPKTIQELGLTPEATEALSLLVPETLNLAHQPEARARVFSEKDQWLSKPTDSGFGQGIAFGENHPSEEWKALIDERSQDGFVFQQRIPYPTKEMLDITEDGSVVRRLVEFDFCPHHVNGAFSGTALVRGNLVGDGSEGANKMNLAQGGFLIPMVAYGE